MKSEVLNQTKNKPLKVGDVVIIPGMSGCKSYPPFRAKVIFTSIERNWCRMVNHLGSQTAISLSRANELERCAK